MKRIENLRNILERNRTDGFMVSSKVNLAYLSGFTGSSGLGLVTQQELLLIVDGRYVEQAEKQAHAWTVERLGDDVIVFLRDRLALLGVKTLGIEAERVSQAKYEELRAGLDGTQLMPTRGWVEGLRVIKDTTEIAAIEKAVSLGEDVLEQVVSGIRAGITEREIAAELYFRAMKAGAEATAFETIVVSGPRTSLPHGMPTERVLQPGELLTIDFGVILDGYCSDITRTYAVGDCDSRQREVYKAVLGAHLAAAEAIKPGMTGVEAYETAVKTLQEAGLHEYFVHGLGHGVGLEVHEAPRLARSKGAERPLEPGMTVTIEPGVYIPGWGGVRIEDLYVVKDTGLSDLNHSSRELRVLC
ncbi:MAG TPA: aminopeptidase P family protein [Firmicutes bacterium]|nr:aminopeptidase P family protein [Bacillota bacterium]